MTKKNKRKDGPKKTVKNQKTTPKNEKKETKREDSGAIREDLPENVKILGGNWKKCPRCGTSDTMAASTRGEIMIEGSPFVLQIRKCRRPICRYSFKALKPN